jgi:hypothetical protein
MTDWLRSIPGYSLRVATLDCGYGLQASDAGILPVSQPVILVVICQMASISCRSWAAAGSERIWPSSLLLVVRCQCIVLHRDS